MMEVPPGLEVSRAGPWPSKVTPDPSRRTTRISRGKDGEESRWKIFQAEGTINKREITRCLQETFQSGCILEHEGAERHGIGLRCGWPKP